MTSQATPDTLRKFLVVLDATLNYSASIRKIGYRSTDTFYQWIKRSREAQKNDDTTSMYWLEVDGAFDWFHQWVAECHDRSIADIEANARLRARDGTLHVVRFRGETVYRRDPALVGRPWLIELLGLPDDLLRDPKTGLPQPELEWCAPPAELVDKVLAANSKLYSKRSTIDANVRVSGGVLVVPTALPAQSQPRPAIAAPLPVVEVLESVSNTEPERDEDVSVLPSSPEPAAPVVIQEPAPEPYKPTASAAMSPLQRDLLARLRGDPLERSANPVSPITKGTKPQFGRGE